MSAPESGALAGVPESRWRSPVTGRRFDTTVAVRSEEAQAITELGVRNLRRLRYHDPAAPGLRRSGTDPWSSNEGASAASRVHRVFRQMPHTGSAELRMRRRVR